MDRPVMLLCKAATHLVTNLNLLVKEVHGSYKADREGAEAEAKDVAKMRKLQLRAANVKVELAEQAKADKELAEKIADEVIADKPESKIIPLKPASV